MNWEEGGGGRDREMESEKEWLSLALGVRREILPLSSALSRLRLLSRVLEPGKDLETRRKSIAEGYGMVECTAHAGFDGAERKACNARVPYRGLWHRQ